MGGKAALKDSVTEENVYSEEYLGKMLALAGKLYFAQVDIADTIAADMYDVSVTRSLSECITGYEVKTSSLYGRTTSLSAGNLYIDVDTDSHVVVSLEGKEDVPREYMMSTGIMGSAYESIIWEQITGYESVSTISVLQNAAENGIEIFAIGKPNLSAQLDKLNVSESVRQDIVNAVNSGKLVTIPAENVTIGSWSGTGYIITNPQTGTGAYMISGGLNGGITPETVESGYLLGMMIANTYLELACQSIIGQAELLAEGIIFGSTILEIGAIYNIYKATKTVVELANAMAKWTEQYYDYILSDNDEDGAKLLSSIGKELKKQNWGFLKSLFLENKVTDWSEF